MKKELWQKIIHFAITILTAIATTLGTTSCIGHDGLATRIHPYEEKKNCRSVPHGALRQLGFTALTIK